MEGWIKLYRQISENKLWKIRPFGKGQAWIDILMHTSISDWYLETRGISILVKKGQCAMSKLTMSERWGWSTKKVSNFLKMLENENQIEIQNSNVTTLITIRNWELYQSKEQQKENQKKTRRKPEENNKEGKEGKEGKEKTYSEFQNVKLSTEEFKKLTDKFGSHGRDLRIENLGEYVASKGKKYKSHYATILSWDRKDGNKSSNAPKPTMQAFDISDLGIEQ